MELDYYLAPLDLPHRAGELESEDLPSEELEPEQLGSAPEPGLARVFQALADLPQAEWADRDGHSVPALLARDPADSQLLEMWGADHPVQSQDLLLQVIARLEAHAPQKESFHFFAAFQRFGEL